jgi:low temperature requirement protein LtrA
MAGALWWLYFDSAADVNERLLTLAGGSPTMGRAIFAIGQMMPAFALILVASGATLLLDGDAPRGAAWMLSAGLAWYVAGTRALLTIMPSRRRYDGALRVAIIAGTVQLAWLHDPLGDRGLLYVAAAWAAACAALATVGGRRRSEWIERMRERLVRA